MSDYYGDATLEDWLAEEVFSVPHGDVPAEVVALFERWRDAVRYQIESWWDTDEGEGRYSWRAWGRGFNAIRDSEQQAFDEAVACGREILSSR